MHARRSGGIPCDSELSATNIQIYVSQIYITQIYVSQ
jgi:hypothetical protein